MLERLALPAMGTRFEIVLVPETGLSAAHLRAAGEAALAEIEEADHRLSLFRTDSLLSLINRSAFAQAVGLDGETLQLLSNALEVHEKSDGAFDITVAPLMVQRGLHTSTRGTGPASVAAGSSTVVLDRTASTVRFTEPACAIDLGAIAKGHALDLAAEVLRDAGVERALLHGGTSTVLALGPPPGKAAWRISLAHEPDAPPVELAHGALSVSSGSGRRAPDGTGHVLDPRTGQAVPTGRYAATLAPTATLADAWSTALLVDPTLTPDPRLRPLSSAALLTTP